MSSRRSSRATQLGAGSQRPAPRGMPRRWPKETRGAQGKQRAVPRSTEPHTLQIRTPTGWLKKTASEHKTRSWTDHEERKLWELAGYETAARIGERLGRSEGAVRCRLKMLGLSVRVKDGWSYRAIQQLVACRPSKFRRFVVHGSLRVRDPRISPSSLIALCKKRTTSAQPSAEEVTTETLRQKLRKGSNSDVFVTPMRFHRSDALISAAGACQHGH